MEPHVQASRQLGIIGGRGWGENPWNTTTGWLRVGTRVMMHGRWQEMGRGEEVDTGEVRRPDVLTPIFETCR